MTRANEWDVTQRTVSIDVGPGGVKRLRDIFLRLRSKGGEYKRINRPTFLRALLGIEEKICLSDEEQAYLSGRLDALPEWHDDSAPSQRALSAKTGKSIGRRKEDN